MFGKWSNMAHAKNYFREKNSVFLRVFGLQSGEYSKIISERMKGTAGFRTKLAQLARDLPQKVK